MLSKSKSHPYISNPLQLLKEDVFLFFKLSITWPLTSGLLSIVWPMWPASSGDLDEISFTRQNGLAICLHVILCISQSAFIIGAVTSCIFGFPLPPFLYTPVCLALVVLFVYGNKVFCILLNGTPGHVFGAGRQYAANPSDDVNKWYSHNPEHKGERWVLINGVAVGSHWLQNNLERLARTFHRPILGIHNRTYGILFDIVECVIQRTFNYATTDIRVAYETISNLLVDGNVTKVVLIAHSQGSIEAGMVLDWLYATMSEHEIGKLEVFTFGNASNHWNCPRDGNGAAIVRHMEHYVNLGDWVSRFGILNFRPRFTASLESRRPFDSLTLTNLLHTQKAISDGRTTIQPKDQGQEGQTFVGRMFVRQATGHQLNQHYLDNIFPLNKQLSQVAELGAADFMSSRIDVDMLQLDDTVQPIHENIVAGNGNANNTVSEGAAQTVKDYSRLWRYINGRTPDDSQQS